MVPGLSIMSPEQLEELWRNVHRLVHLLEKPDPAVLRAAPQPDALNPQPLRLGELTAQVQSAFFRLG